MLTPIAEAAPVEVGKVVTEVVLEADEVEAAPLLEVVLFTTLLTDEATDEVDDVPVVGRTEADAELDLVDAADEVVELAKLVEKDVEVETTVVAEVTVVAELLPVVTTALEDMDIAIELVAVA